MGIYLNPRNDRFKQARNSRIYVDKSGLICETNIRMHSEQKYLCVSRPRRFGKSLNLGMLAAYYSRGCESRALFDDLMIAQDEKYAAVSQHEQECQRTSCNAFRKPDA